MIVGGVSGVNNAGTMTSLTNHIGGTIQSLQNAIINTGSIGTFSNSGLLSGSNGYGTILPAAGIYNSGTITGLTNTATGTIVGGITNNGGAIGTLSNSGTIIGASYAINSGGANSTIGAITHTGLISGNIQIANQDVTIGGGARQGTLSGGAITIANGNLTFASGSQLLADSISVNGGLGGVTNNATLEVRSVLSVTGSLVEHGTYVEDITSSSVYGKLTVSGAASFGGMLDMQLLGGMVLSFGEVFNLFSFTSSSGDFTGFELNGVACTSASADLYACGGYSISETITGTQLDLKVGRPVANVPEPASMTLFGVALAALAGLRRRKRA